MHPGAHAGDVRRGLLVAHMNRRSFLSMLGAGATGIVLPEPRRIYSFPSAWWLERERAGGRIYSAEDISISFNGETLKTADGFEFEGQLFKVVPADDEAATVVRRSVASALRRRQNYINLEGLRSVVIRGKVSV
jgi:hypothetical protein